MFYHWEFYVWMVWVNRIWVNVQEKMLIFLLQNHKLSVVGLLERQEYEHDALRWRTETIIFQLFWESNCTVSLSSPTALIVPMCCPWVSRSHAFKQEAAEEVFWEAANLDNTTPTYLSSILHSTYIPTPHSLALCSQIVFICNTDIETYGDLDLIMFYHGFCYLAGTTFSAN